MKDLKTEEFNSYSPEARRSLFFAYAVAQQAGSEIIDGVHLLLGLMRENIALLNRFLSPPLTDRAFQSEIPGDASTSPVAHENLGGFRFNPEGKRTLSFATEEADRMGSRHVGIEHLFLALLRDENSVAASLLHERGADITRIRKELAERPHAAPTQEERMFREVETMRKILAEVQEENRRQGLELQSKSDIFGRYSVKAHRLIFFARHYAVSMDSPLVEAEHLFLAVVREERTHFNLFFPFADSNDAVCKQVMKHLTGESNFGLNEKCLSTDELPPLSEQCEQVLGYAEEEATLLGSEHIGPEHLLLGMLREKDSYAAVILAEYGAEIERIRRQLAA